MLPFVSWMQVDNRRAVVICKPLLLISTSRLAVLWVVLSACAACFSEEKQSAFDFSVPRSFLDLSRTSCVDCHSGSEAEARLDVELLAKAPLEKHLKDWRRIKRVMSDGSMPPKDYDRPNAELHESANRELHEVLRRIAMASASDPGPTLLRRITNAEYEYCIQDLTGVTLPLRRTLMSDSVGSSGFTNAATGQFVQDATLERYLEAAKMVADHVMIGTGPLYFYSSPGQTGLEISSVKRIQAIYRKHGFRVSAGEGAEPYGMHRFAKAFIATWQFKHREELGFAKSSLTDFAERNEVEPKFVEHVWQVLNRESAGFPLSKIVDAWKKIPSPSLLSVDSTHDNRDAIEAESERLFQSMRDWQTRFAGAAADEENAAILARGTVRVPSSVNIEATAIRKRIVQDQSFTIDLNDEEIYAKDRRIRFRISVEAASQLVGNHAVVIFSDPTLEFRTFERLETQPAPLREVLDTANRGEFRFGENPGGSQISDESFVIAVGETKEILVEMPERGVSAEFVVKAELDADVSNDCVARCTVADVTSQGDPKFVQRTREYSSLIRDPDSESIDAWEEGLAEFADALPMISHREPTPSDRDPIPKEYDNTYNLPERNYFHTAVKYARDDAFLVDHILPKAVALELDRAWADLLSSFDYHDINLRFLAKKFGLDLGKQNIATLDTQWIAAAPREIQDSLSRFKNSYEYLKSLRHLADNQHIANLSEFATRVWRRPLTHVEHSSLNEFYAGCRDSGLGHEQAVRSSLVRILVSPNFLYRLEGRAGRTAAVVDGSHRYRNASPLSESELASRLSFSFWSSLPDSELVAIAERRDLQNDDVLHAQVDRMLRSSKARRMATEFFGQWLGFYRFNEFRGVDTKRFPEFDGRLRDSLYDEAITFFEHILREDRPYTEILQADYTFVDNLAAEHYGLKGPLASPQDEFSDARYVATRRIQVPADRRGGLLGLGAIMAATSAPLRTSPVKRGDWILRRLIGTPVPPPPG